MTSAPDDRLDSWKEIAAYLKRSVRTVRRWEREEGLPVHRHVHRTLASVYAQRSELDAWRRKLAQSPGDAQVEVPRDAPERNPSIAVLPFENLSANPENDYFADGLTEEITATLSNVRALRVTSRTSSRTLRGTTKSVKAIAAQLGVRYLLEGSVRRAGNRLRVTAQLIDAVNDDHLWADTYQGTMEDVFAIQERLAREITGALELRLTAEEERRIAARPIDSLPAYDCYLRARYEGWRWRKDAIDRAVHLLREALTIIGDNARLYAALGLAYLQYREAGIDFSEEPLLKAAACAAKVFALEPGSSDGLRLRGWLHYSRGHVQEAVRDLKAAFDIDPNNADTLLLLSYAYIISGRVSHARPLLERLIAVDPMTPLTRCMPACAEIFEGHFEAALGPYRLMFEMDTSNPMNRLFYIWVLILNRRLHAVMPVIEGFAPEVRETAPARIALFLAHATAGNRVEAEAALTREIEDVAPSSDVFLRFLAEGYAILGMPEPALHWLSAAVDRGFINYPFLAQHDPFFADLRDDVRFRNLLEGVRARWEKFET